MSEFDYRENKYTDKVPAYIRQYNLYDFLKALTNYIKTGEDALEEVCRCSNINFAKGDLLIKLGRKIGAAIPTQISVTDKDALVQARIVIRGTILNAASDATGKNLINIISNLYPTIDTSNIVVEDNGIKVDTSDMSYILRIYANLGTEDTKYIKQYLMPKYLGVDNELQLVYGNIMAFDKNEDNPDIQANYYGWDKGEWTTILA